MALGGGSPLVSTRVDASYDSLEATRVLVPKVHINGKINSKMEKYF